jgi:hypothetical protein
MNQKQMFVLVAGVVIAGAALWQSAAPVVPCPQPEPTPIIDPDVKPDPQPEPITGIAETAANDGATFLNAIGQNCGAAAKKLRAGEFETPDQVHDWLKQVNDAARLEAFKPWHAEIQTAIKTKDAKKLADLLEQSAKGFPAAIKGQ